ncbi:MAG: hypothetical protein ACRC10_12975 [Thermoguttaceae bacterium]
MSTTIDVLAPFEIWEVPLGLSTIKFHQPLVLTPSFLPDDPEEPDNNEYLCIECPELNISANGANREELLECVQVLIRHNWQHFVCLGNERLRAATRDIKNNYLAIAEEV